jgi:hypothetical protein
LEDFITLLDTTSIITLPLSVIFYHVLDIKTLEQDNDLGIHNYEILRHHFEYNLGHLFNKDLQEAIESLWILDDCLIPSEHDEDDPSDKHA